MNNSLYLVCGLPGSGAQTYAYTISQKSKFSFITVDHMDNFMRDPPDYYPIYRTVWNKVHSCMINDLSCVCYVPGLTYLDRITFLLLFPEFKYHHLVWVNAPVSVCLANCNIFSYGEIFRMRKIIDKVTRDDICDWSTVTILKNIKNEIFIKGIYCSPTFAVDTGEENIFA